MNRAKGSVRCRRSKNIGKILAVHTTAAASSSNSTRRAAGFLVPAFRTMHIHARACRHEALARSKRRMPWDRTHVALSGTGAWSTVRVYARCCQRQFRSSSGYQVLDQCNKNVTYLKLPDSCACPTQRSPVTLVQGPAHGPSRHRHRQWGQHIHITHRDSNNGVYRSPFDSCPTLDVSTPISIPHQLIVGPRSRQLTQSQHLPKACQTSLQPMNVMLQQHPALLAAALSIESLLRVAALRTSPEVAGHLKSLYLERLRAALSSQSGAAVGTGVAKSAQLIVAMQQLLPWLSAAVTSACSSSWRSSSGGAEYQMKKDVEAAVLAAISSYEMYVHKRECSTLHASTRRSDSQQSSVAAVSDTDFSFCCVARASAVSDPATLAGS